MLTIPRGKKVKFSGYGIPSEVENYEFHLEEDITLKATSQFSAVVDADPNKFVTLAIGALNSTIAKNMIPAGNKYFGYQQWAGTEPLAFSFSIGAYLDQDSTTGNLNLPTSTRSGWTNVVRPTTALLKLPLPFQSKGLGGKFGGLVAPGPDVVSVLAGDPDRQLNVRIGSLYIPNVVVTDAEATFSNDTDEFYHPIWAKIRLSVKTVFTAHTGMIDQLMPMGGNF